MSSRSAAVSTAATPSISSAAAASMPRISACACGLRRTLPCSMPAISMSPTYCACPRSFSAASLRGLETPTSPSARRSSTLVSVIEPGQLACRREDRAVARAAADVALEAVADLLLGAQLAGVAQALERQQQAGRAVAALQRRVAHEGVLELRELGGLREALDGQHRASARLDGEVGARAHRPAVDQHRARAADLDVAGALRAGQSEPLAQE